MLGSAEEQVTDKTVVKEKKTNKNKDTERTESTRQKRGRGHKSPPQAQDKVQRALFLNVVVRQRAAVLQLLSGKDEALLVGRDALLVLDAALDLIYGEVRLHIQRDGLPWGG